MVERRKKWVGFYSNRAWWDYSNYSVEIADIDVEALEITGAEDTMILNIVTLPHDQSGKYRSI